jgi:ABC-type lipoprotein export system ATPase subunit
MVEVQKQLMRERKVSGGGSELFVIDGDRGSGKSCLLNYLTIFARQENWYHF